MWKRLHVKYLLFLFNFNETLIFQQIFEKKELKMPSFIKICPMGAEFFRAEEGRTDGRADEHDKSDSRFLRFCKRS
jgi:hypothetical protein